MYFMYSAHSKFSRSAFPAVFISHSPILGVFLCFWKKIILCSPFSDLYTIHLHVLRSWDCIFCSLSLGKTFFVRCSQTLPLLTLPLCLVLELRFPGGVRVHFQSPSIGGILFIFGWNQAVKLQVLGNADHAHASEVPYSSYLAPWGACKFTWKGALGNYNQLCQWFTSDGR